MTEPQTASAMAREIAEIPAAAARLLARTDVLATIVARVEQAKPRMVVFCGRGSSGHVGVYLRYLVEARLGLLVSNAAPSVVTAYRRPPDMRDALFVVVSQSGRSPDLVTATRVARPAGALTLAIVNDEASPAAAESELVLPVGAGPEHAVAATKTVVLSMIAGAQLVAALARDDDLGDGLQHLAPRLSRALACDWSAWADRAADAAVSFVAGRGYALGCVREIALKVAETCGCRRSATARRSSATGRAPRSRRRRPCWCCARTTRPPPPSTSSCAISTMRARRCSPPEGRRDAAVDRRRSPDVRSGGHARSRPIGRSRRRRAGAASIPTTRRTSPR